MKHFTEKVAVITGAASGIGLASARAFADEGMHVVLLDNREEELLKAVKSIQVEGVQTLALVVDVTDANAVEQAAKKVIETFGAVHVLMNNAAVFLRGPEIVDVQDDVWDWILKVNLYGTLNCVRSFLPLMQANDEDGHLITSCSISGFNVSQRKNGVYATSKFALVALSEALAIDLKDSKIQVSVLLPAAVSSDFYLSSAAHRGDLGGANMYPETPKDTAAGMSPDEVAARLVEGVKNNRFYIATHPSARVALVARHNEIMASFDAAEAFEMPDHLKG